MSFQQDIGSEYQTTPIRTLSPIDKTSSDTEVVGNLLVSAFAKEYRDEIAQHIVITAKSVLNLYLHAVFGWLLHTGIIIAPRQTVASGMRSYYAGLISSP